MTKKTLGFFLGLAIGSSSVFVYDQMQHRDNPSGFPVLERTGYTMSYDTRAKIPFWTHEHLTKDSLEVHAERAGMDFKEDEEIYPLHRSQLSDYYQSGFDRGHHAPAANHRLSEEELRETFLLTNISPQDAQFNRGLWAKLEKIIRILAKETEWVDITTGPLFLAHDEADGRRLVTYQVIGKNDVAVPTHFFKVISTPDRSWAYVIPNGPAKGSLSDYITPISEVEKLAGIRLTNL